ncbi:MAG: DUF4097 family beta strand repeat protein [Lachnospiraceae bacterium]|nr:DUF4097 family beta strand repeat protein [Lachnospiraceae bacterium]
MNGIQKVIKYCAMAFAVFLSVVIIGSIAAVVLRVVAGVAIGNEISESRERVDLSEQYSAEEIVAQGINSILIDCSGEILVQPGEVLSIEATNITEDYEIRLENGRVSLKSHEPDFLVNVFSWFGDMTEQEKVVVTVPAEFMPQEVKLYSGSGKVFVDALTADLLFIDSGFGKVNVTNGNFKETELDTGSGSVTVKDSKLGKLYLDSGSGAIRMENVVAEDAEVDSGSGAVTFAGELTGDCDFETGSGAITLSLNGYEEDYRIEADCGSGTFRVNGKKLEDGSYGRNVKGELNIDSGSGSVSVEFTEE